MKTLLVLLIAFSTLSKAYACSCARGSLEERFEQSKVVVHAQVVSVRVGTVVGAGRYSRNRVTDLEAQIAEIEILKSLKGDAALEYVYLGATESLCGVEVQEDDEWLFFTNLAGRVDPCGGHVLRPREGPAPDEFDARIGKLLAYSAANPGVGSVALAECQVNGFQLGTSKA